MAEQYVAHYSGICDGTSNIPVASVLVEFYADAPPHTFTFGLPPGVNARERGAQVLDASEVLIRAARSLNARAAT